MTRKNSYTDDTKQTKFQYLCQTVTVALFISKRSTGGQERSNNIVIEPGCDLCHEPTSEVHQRCCLLRGQISTTRKSVNINSRKKMRIFSASFPDPPFFRSPRTIFTKAENVTMGTHYQATSVAWHDAQ